jgi:hypothetical protein
MSPIALQRTSLRWAARFAGGTGLAYSGLYVLGGRLGDSGADETRLLPVLLFFAALAYLAAWWREIEGGTALAVVAVALGGVAFTFAPPDPFLASVALSLPLFVAGGLFVASGWFRLGNK